MADKGVSFAGGDALYAPKTNVNTAIPEQPKKTSGGPIMVPDGIDKQNSTTVPANPTQIGGATEIKGATSGSPIKSPVANDYVT